MANPVMNSIVKDWSAQTTTPAGYPAMPGYQPASQQAHNPFGGSTNPYGAPEESGPSGAQAGRAADRGPVYGVPQGAPAGYDDSMASYEAMMNAPAADAVDRGTMTYDDVVVKSLMCFGLLLVGATAGWMTGLVAIGAAMMVALAACAVTLGLALFIQFSKKVRPGAIVAYSLIEGFVLGALSCAFEAMFPGIVVSAVLATLVVIGVTLGAFTMGVLAVFIGVLCLVRDFDAVKVGVANNVPEKYSWLCTFAIMTDVIWIYLEILRILSYLMRRN